MHLFSFLFCFTTWKRLNFFLNDLGFISESIFPMVSLQFLKAGLTLSHLLLVIFLHVTNHKINRKIWLTKFLDFALRLLFRNIFIVRFRTLKSWLLSYPNVAFHYIDTIQPIIILVFILFLNQLQFYRRILDGALRISFSWKWLLLFNWWFTEQRWKRFQFVFRCFRFLFRLWCYFTYFWTLRL